MKLIKNIQQLGWSAAMICLLFTACNKATVVPIPITQPTQLTTPTLANLLDTPSLSIFKAAVVKAGLLPTLSVPTLRFTVFAPDNAAMTASGLTLAAINALPVTTITPLVSYHIIPQAIAKSGIPDSFPNFQYPTILNPAPTLSALLRLTTFPSSRNGLWVNNIPITTTNIQAVNGIMHNVARAVAPPTRYLWNRIDTDPDFTILKAAVQRADSGVAQSASGSLIGAMLNIGANLTLFAPNNQAFKNLISGLTGGAIPPTAPDAPFIAFIGSNNVSTQLMKGIAVYHILGSRAFTNNFPTTARAYPTLLNGAVPAHPGITLRCTFTGPSVSVATCKGAGNATASNLLINPLPDPNGTSDQHFLNGTIHKIDQVMLPQ